MNNKRKIKARLDGHRSSWARPGENIEIAFIPGATINEPAAIEAMQQQTHDGIIELTGARRRSGVQWHIIKGSAECTAYLDKAYEDSADQWAVDQFRAFIAEYGDRSVIVVADVECV